MTFTGLAILDVGTTLDEAMRPFCDVPGAVAEVAHDEHGNPYNPEGKWDAYEVGGWSPLRMVARDGLLGERAVAEHGGMLRWRLGRVRRALETSWLFADDRSRGSLWRCSRMPRDPVSGMVLCDVALVDDVVSLMECPWFVLAPDGTWHDCDDAHAAYERGEEWWDAFHRDFLEPHAGRGCLACFLGVHD